MKQKKIKSTETAPRTRQFRSKKKNLQASLEADPQQNEVPPSYEAPNMDSSDLKKVLRFSKLIANEDVLAALEQASYQVPSDLLFTVMPATLRGSDSMIFKSKQPDAFLIGVVPAISKILYSENVESKETKPVALFLFPSEASAKSACGLTLDTFQNLKIKFVNLNADSSELGDVIFTTPKFLVEAAKNHQFKLNSFKLVTVHELNAFEGEDKVALNSVLSAVSQSNIQKIFLSYQNTPQLRELAFKYLEDPEIFSFLPQGVTEQYPRQFAHALEATKKFQVLLGYLKTYRPRAALVVANTRTVAEWIAFKLNGNGIKIALMTSPVSPYENRIKLLESISNGEINVFVSTDDAIKNFGIENLHCIYHFDLPDKPLLFVDRLHKLMGARNPISIAFVCEDYGFNMGKIEETLGFKIRVTTPDKNFFNFKDTSDYPLESNGRVKSLDQPAEPQHVHSEQPQKLDKVEQKFEQKVEQEIKLEQKSEQRVEHKSEQKLEKRSDRVDKPISLDDARQTTRVQRSQQRTHHQPDTTKFVRRDERAREAVADAVLAARMAEEKRQAQNAQTHHRHKTTESSSDTKNTNTISALFSVFSDAFRAGIDATKASLLHSTEHKLPALHRFLKRKDKK